MAFSSGFRAGVDAWQSMRRADRQKILDQQEDERFSREKTNWGREDAARAREDAAWAQYDTAVGANTQQPNTPMGGLPVPQQRTAPPTLGSAPAGSGATMAPGGAAPAMTADGPAMQPNPAAAAPAVSALDRQRAMETALGGISAARRDVTGVRTSQTNQRGMQMQQVTNDVMKMSDDDIAGMAKQLNTNNSNVPLLYAGKGKGGYTFMTMSPDGEPQGQFKLNMSQMRQLVLSNALAQQGFGAEALDLASRTHGAIGKAMMDWNETLGSAAKTNNAATHSANTDANNAARLGETARHNRASEGMARDRMNREDWAIVGATDDNKGMLRFNRRTGQTEAVPMPAGTDAGGLFRKVTGQGGAGAFKEAPAAGTIMSDGRRSFKADGQGGMLALKAPMLEERSKVLDKAGIEPGFAQDLQWDSTGQYVRFGGMNYDATKPSDLSALRKDIARLAAGTKAVEEGNRDTFLQGARNRQATERADPAYFDQQDRPSFRAARP